VKIIVAGDSGSGKTGSLAALANAGYELFIQDYDNGVDPLYKYVKPEARSRVHFVTLADQISVSGITVQVSRADSFTRGMNLLSNWTEDKQSFGAVSTWDKRRVLVIDSLTMMANAAVRLVLAQMGNMNFKPTPEKGERHPMSVIGEAQNKLEALFGLLFSPAIKCNVVLISHIKAVGEGENERFFPSSVGKALPPILPRYFNWMVEYKQEKGQRIISTIPGRLTTKAPADLPPILQISDGLLRIFDAVNGPFDKILAAQPPKKLAEPPRAATNQPT
jgi:hypothetical protein